MKQSLPTQVRLFIYLVVFGFLIFLLDRFCLPYIGMLASSILTGVLMAGLLGAYIMVSSREQDERERLLQLQSDSAALYVVIAGLMAASIFYPHSQFGMAFWGVSILAVFGRVVTFLYQKHK